MLPLQLIYLVSFPAYPKRRILAQKSRLSLRNLEATEALKHNTYVARRMASSRLT